MPADPTETATLRQLIADLAEDLAIELLAEFDPHEYVHLEHSIEKLIRAEATLTAAGCDVPATVAQVLRSYKKQAN